MNKEDEELLKRAKLTKELYEISGYELFEINIRMASYTRGFNTSYCLFEAPIEEL